MRESAKETPETIVAALLDPDRRETAANVRRLTGLGLPGLYAWFIDATGALEIAAGLGLPLKEGLIYAGQTGAGTSGRTLQARLVGNHLTGNTYGSTFRLSLASILMSQLGLRPSGGRRMAKEDEPKLSAWMSAHLSVAAYPIPDRATVDRMETAVLVILDPPLNLSKLGPSPTRSRLTELRSAFSNVSEQGKTPVAAPTAVEPPSPPQAPIRSQKSTTQGFTPEELARDLGLPNAKGLRAYLRHAFPRSPGELWSRWGVLPPHVEAAARAHFGRHR